jgi:hypothetical protein
VDRDDVPGGTPLALAVWWGNPNASQPGVLDGVFVLDSADSADSATDRTTLAAGLLTAAHAAFAGAGMAAPPEYHVFLPVDWHDQPDVVVALAWRKEAARRAGLPASVERLRCEWTPPTGLPEPSGHVLFRAEPDDEVFVDLFRRVLTGTLDAASRKGVEQIGAEAQARDDVAFYRDTMHGARAWWRIAQTPDGEVVGFCG